MPSDVEQECQKRLQLLELRLELQLSWKHVSNKLASMGYIIDDRVLANRINRGSFPADFANSGPASRVCAAQKP